MVRDLLDLLRNATRRDALFALAALAVTSLIGTGFLLESQPTPPRQPPQLVFVENWSANRSRDDAVARQRVELAALREEVGLNRLGIAEADVATARTEAARDKARRQAAEARILIRDGAAQRAALIARATPARRAELEAIVPMPGSPATPR